MRLSIVIPTKNEEAYLPHLLASIRSQKFTDYEIIVADAGSRDQTRMLAASFGARVVSGGLPGPGRNRGARHARGDMIVYFDADVVLPHPFFLRDCLREIEERGLDVATCQPEPQDGTLLDRAMHRAYHFYSKATEKFLPHAPGFCVFVTRAAHHLIGGFDEEVVFAEDHDYVRRACRAGSRFGILRGHRVPVSVRRMEKDGRLRIAAKYVFSELYMLTRGSFKQRTPFRYDFEYETAKADAASRDS